MDTITVSVKLFGGERDVEFRVNPHGQSVYSVAPVVVGRFPTGTKLHGSSLTLWKRERETGTPLRGTTAAVINGDEYVADFTLYIHNSNRGRIVSWNEDAWAANSGWGRAY